MDEHDIELCEAIITERVKRGCHTMMVFNPGSNSHPENMPPDHQSEDKGSTQQETNE